MLWALVSTRAAAAAAVPLRTQTLCRGIRRAHTVASAAERKRVIGYLSTATDLRTKALRAVRRELATQLDGHQVDLVLLNQALTHRAYGNLHVCASNRKLEWIGDACLQSVATDELCSKFQALDVGDMAYLRTMVTCNAALVGPARHLHLGEAMLLLDADVERFAIGFADDCPALKTEDDVASFSASEAVLADAMEAVIGAVYADYGDDEYAIEEARTRARQLVKRMLAACLEDFFKKLSANPLWLAQIPKHEIKTRVFAMLRWPRVAGAGAVDPSLAESTKLQPDAVAMLRLTRTPLLDPDEPQPDAVAPEVELAVRLKQRPGALSCAEGLFVPALLEWAQGTSRAKVIFGSTEQQGVSDTYPIFKIEVHVSRREGEGFDVYIGAGGTKKAAKSAAARSACKALMPEAFPACAETDRLEEIWLGG